MSKRTATSENGNDPLKDRERPDRMDVDNDNKDMGDFEDEFEDEFESEDEIIEAGVDGRPDAEREAEEKAGMLKLGSLPLAISQRSPPCCKRSLMLGCESPPYSQE